MTKEEALEAIHNGNKVKGSALGVAEVIYMDDNNEIVSSRGKFFDMTTVKEQNWTIYERREQKSIISPTDRITLKGVVLKCCTVGYVRTPFNHKQKITILKQNI